MAGGMDLGTANKGGKKALDAAINLVPFIDLMAVTISFLIMTAVWTQLGRLQVSSAGGAGSSDDPSQPISLRMTEQALTLTVGGAVSDPMPLVRGAHGGLDLRRLTAKLTEVRAAFPEQRAITLQPGDAVKYDDLVKVIDGVIGAGLPSIQVIPGEG